MHLPTLFTLPLAALSSAFPLAQPPSPTAPSPAISFWIPSFSGEYPPGFFAPGNPNHNVVNFNISLFDVNENNQGIPGYFVGCSTSFTLPAYPTAATPVSCPAGFSFYFASFTDIADFTISVQHTYENPKTGTTATYFAAGTAVNNATAHNEIQYNCSVDGARELRSCVARFDDVNNPVVVPITEITD